VTILGFTLLIALGAFAAGFLGSLTGLGGGVVIVPLLLLCGVPLHFAQGASLVSVIATSSGAAASYVKEGFSNIRIGMFLEIATTLGALAGAFLIAFLRPEVIEIVFGGVLIFSAHQSVRQRREAGTPAPPDRLAAWLRLNSSYPTIEGRKYYQVYRVKLGFALMFLAGVLSGLLGIGSGALKVLAMDQAMRIPFKVSTTTSNFMIGVTAAASAGIYLSRGYLDPAIAMPVTLGVVLGALLGARVLTVVETRWLRLLFGVLIFALAVEMIFKGLTGRL